MLLSFVVTSYNRRQKIASAIDSILNQPGFENFAEIVIVDDCSSDNTVEYITSKYKNYIERKLIKVILLEKNLGVTGAKNAGFNYAAGDWVVFLDCDDLLLSDRLITMYELLKKNMFRPIVFFRCINDNGDFVGQAFSEDKLLDITTYIKHSSYGESLTAINKVLVKNHPYIEKLRGYEGLGCSRIIEKYGDALLSTLTARVYVQNDNDRLSVGHGLLGRLSLIAKGHLLMVREFSKYMPFSKKISLLIKGVFYYVIGKIYLLIYR